MKRWALFHTLTGNILEIEADEFRKTDTGWTIRANGSVVGEIEPTAIGGYILIDNIIQNHTENESNEGEI